MAARSRMNASAGGQGTIGRPAAARAASMPRAASSSLIGAGAGRALFFSVVRACPQDPCGLRYRYPGVVWWRNPSRLLASVLQVLGSKLTFRGVRRNPGQPEHALLFQIPHATVAYQKRRVGPAHRSNL